MFRRYHFSRNDMALGRGGGNTFEKMEELTVFAILPRFRISMCNRIAFVNFRKKIGVYAPKNLKKLNK